MKTETINKYICDYCGREYCNKQIAEDCERLCKEHIEQAKHTSTKFKVGDVVKATDTCWAFIIKFVEKHKVKNTWIYSGTKWYTDKLKNTEDIEDDEYFYALHKEEEENLNLIYTAQEFEEIRKKISDNIKMADIGIDTDGVVIKLEGMI